MDDDSVVQLENEVIEFLRRWSSTSSEVVRLQRVDSGEDSLGRTDELSSETPVMGGSPDSIELHGSVGDEGGMHWRGGQQRCSRGSPNPHRAGGSQIRSRSQAVPRWGSYAAEMKAASPSRYRRLKERMAKISDR